MLSLLLLAGAMIAQTRSPHWAITDLLMTTNDPAVTQDSLSARLAESLQQEARSPVSKASVESFARSLVAGLSGKQLVQAQASNLTTRILAVVHGAEPNSATVRRVREALARLGVDQMRQAQIARRLMAIAEQVRGPDDTPIRRPLLLRPRN